MTIDVVGRQCRPAWNSSNQHELNTRGWLHLLRLT